MSSMVGWGIYFGLGFLYMLWEHSAMEVDFSQASRTQAILFSIQQIVHYLRLIATWPTYFIEDMTIIAMNSASNGDDDDDSPIVQ